MTDFLVDAIALACSLTLVAGVLAVTWRGPVWRERLWTRAAERRVAQVQARRRARIERGSTSKRTTRALHNDFDFECVYWWGDRRPEANDTTNRDFGGGSTSTTERRCVVCRPYAEDEDRALIGPDPVEDRAIIRRVPHTTST
jgi:hypothetical protein